ncbi:MAG: hypothetical protein GX455_04580 [Phycisphaerae bacterium]|nr:hypothetical protein [Phycisphaerae bacterium]
MAKYPILSVCAILLICASMAQAAFIVEAHSSGRANATNFTGTGTSSIKSTAPGCIATGSIFSGSGAAGSSTEYVYKYTPAMDMDNWSPAPGTDLTNGHKASGLMGGLNGKYNVYITWPPSTNVGGTCSITVTNDGEDVVVSPVDMNTGGTGNPGGNHGWYRVAEKVHLSGGTQYVVRQKVVTSAYVSMRSHGVLWELVEPDPPMITLTETNEKTAVTEGGIADDYTIALLQQPASLTQVSVIAKDPNQVILNGTLNQTVLTFTPDNWATPQTVQVLANDDLDVENDHFTWLRHWVSYADDPNSIFAGFLKVTIADNEAPGVLIVESDGKTAVDEQGPTSDTYTIRLMMAPTAPVTITVAADADTVVASGQASGSSIQLTFTAADWFTPQTVIVTAVDDEDSEFDHTSTITHSVSSADSGYNNLAAAGVVAKVADNDCGVWGYAPADFNRDCHVTLEDFATFASEWMTCSVPYIEGCTNWLPQ